MTPDVSIFGVSKGVQVKNTFFSVFALIALPVALLFSGVTGAATLTPEQWSGLIQKTLYEGEVSKATYGTVVSMGRTRTLSENQVLKVYFSLLGEETEKTYSLSNMSLVTEMVTAKDGKIEILQWSYLFTPKGELQDRWNRRIVKTAAGGITMEELSTDVGAEVIDQQILSGLQYFSNEAAE